MWLPPESSRSLTRRLQASTPWREIWKGSIFFILKFSAMPGVFLLILQGQIGGAMAEHSKNLPVENHNLRQVDMALADEKAAV